MRKTKWLLVFFIMTFSVGSAFAETTQDTRQGAASRATLEAAVGAQKKIQDMTEADYLAILERFKDRPPITKETTQLYLLLSFCNYQLGQYPTAVSLLENVVTANPYDASAWGLLAVAYKAVNEKERSQQALKTFVRLLKENATTTEESREAWLLEKLFE